jgi:ABC-type glycerol-3-phosphate transport system substrate-binding protein
MRKLLLGLVTLALAGCGATTASPTAQATIPPGVTPTPTIESTPTETFVALGVWLPESLATIDGGTGGSELTVQMADFDARRGDVLLSVASKKDGGPGGLLDLLRAASPIAPQALPDVIVLSDADLAVAAREGLIQPLDDLLDPVGESTLFAFARETARIDGRRMGLPLAADFNHLFSRPDRLKTPPVDWADLISGTITFPLSFADGSNVSDAVLSAYALLGGSIIDEEGQPALSLDALARLLTLYRNARLAAVLTTANLQSTDPDASWNAFLSSNTPLTVARASKFLAARADGIELDYARLPAIDGTPPSPIGRSWNLALVARDPRRQAAAAELMTHLTLDENAAAWTQAGHVLPAGAGALALWGQGDDYVAFAQGELRRALPPPSPAAIEAVSSAFMTAIRDVIGGRATPQAAAAAAVDAVARGVR